MESDKRIAPGKCLLRVRRSRRARLQGAGLNDACLLHESAALPEIKQRSRQRTIIPDQFQDNKVDQSRTPMFTSKYLSLPDKTFASLNQTRTGSTFSLDTMLWQHKAKRNVSIDLFRRKTILRLVFFATTIKVQCGYS